MTYSSTQGQYQPHRNAELGHTRRLIPLHSQLQCIYIPTQKRMKLKISKTGSLYSQKKVS